MDPRIKKLVAAFELNGWEYKGTVDQSDWWFSDILQLLSARRPVDRNLFFTLLTDPAIIEKKVVWAVGISTNIPDNRHFIFIDQVTLNDIRKINVHEFAGSITAAVLL